MPKPTLLVVSGANGSGKSTLLNKYRLLTQKIPFINPDN
jgi:predicted ABC-type ATPase